jgi:hypothetical protein
MYCIKNATRKEAAMAKYVLFVFALSLLVLAPAALADWDESMPAKWVQLPDESDYGIDVNASNPFILADDWECTETGPVTAVHIWGSWRSDYLPYGRPDSCTFVLSFHKDIPDSESTTGYSMPGDVEAYRIFRPGEYTARVWLQGVLEGWMDPPDAYVPNADQVIWQYNFPFDDPIFTQQGDPDRPMVYWLDVQAFPHDEEAYFGWKTSRDHWNDDAVWGQGNEPYYGPWGELRYPPGHEYGGQSIDLAFVIQSEPSEIDWGDAPEPAGGAGYPTTSGNNGANHIIYGPWLGDATDVPDADPDGQQEPNALGDDLDILTGIPNDDEDGVQIPVLMIGGTATVTFEVNDGGSGTGGVVESWIDFNADQIWQAAEMVVGGWFPAGVHNVNVTVPAAAVPGQTFSRWRISLNGGLTPVGPAPDGEVEDHEVIIEEDLSKWLQRPDLDVTGMDVHCTEPIILADDFECREPGRIVDIIIWGSWLDDYWPYNEDPAAVDFTLSFHGDIPDSESSTGYSMPADPEWWMYFPAGSFTVTLFADSLQEGWFYPPDGTYSWPADFTCWRYHFRVPVDEAFYQRGTQDDPMVYWLDVQARPHDIYATFGWKTSLDHWNDDGVWGDGIEPYYGSWYELRYPSGHNMEGESIDLAFKLVMDPDSRVPTDGDAPGTLGMFQNVPNPFAGSTTVRYALPSAGHVKLEVFDVEGRLVSVLVDETQSAGMKSAVWEGTDARGSEMPSGVYFYRLTACGEERNLKMLLLK